MFAPTSPPIAAPAAKKGLSAGVLPSSFRRRITPGKVRVVGLRTTERVVDEGRRLKWPVRQILEPAAAALVAHEDVELAVRSESHHAAVVVARRVGVVRPRVSGNGDVVRLQRAQHDDVAVERQRRPVPDEAVDAVAQQRHVGVDGRVRAGAALGPADVHARRRGEVRMQDQAEQSSLRVGVHGKIEHGRGLNDAVDDALDLPEAFSRTRKSFWPRKTIPMGCVMPELSTVVTWRFGSRIWRGMESAARPPVSNSRRRNRATTSLPSVSSAHLTCWG